MRKLPDLKTTKQKGAYYQRKSKLLLEKEGYAVENATGRIIWIKGRPIALHHDFFKLFDLFAVKADFFKLVQVKYMDEESHGWLAQVRKEIAAFPAPPGTKWIHLWLKEGDKVNLYTELAE
jgi:hypothetical protein